MSFIQKLVGTMSTDREEKTRISHGIWLQSPIAWKSLRLNRVELDNTVIWMVGEKISQRQQIKVINLKLNAFIATFYNQDLVFTNITGKIEFVMISH